MERNGRAIKPIYEKQNQQKFVNKRTDLLASLHNIKLPLQHSQSYKENQFQSVPITNSFAFDVQSLPDLCLDNQFKCVKNLKQITLTEDYCKTYGNQVQNALKKQCSKGKFLSNHKIDGTLRARMLDWMVQVMSSYNFESKTYFAGVDIMDRFFASTTQVLVPTQLHLIGVQSMFIATKMEQVYPLKMKTVYDKIAHKKIPIQQLTQMECKIAQALDFNLVSSNFYDLAIIKIAKHLTETDSYSQTLIKQIGEVCSCLGKYICYNYELISLYQKQTLAQTLVNYVFDLNKLSRISKPTSNQLQCKQMIIQSIRGFKQKFKGLNNLVKFTDKKVLDLIQESII